MTTLLWILGLWLIPTILTFIIEGTRYLLSDEYPKKWGAGLNDTMIYLIFSLIPILNLYYLYLTIFRNNTFPRQLR